MTQPTSPLEQATHLLRAGQRDQARALLIRYVRQQPNDENGWLALSQALTDPKQQVDCLERALRINPRNAAAREQLAQLTAPPPPAPPPAVKLPVVPAFEPGSLGEATPNLAIPTPQEPAPPEPDQETDLLAAEWQPDLGSQESPAAPVPKPALRPPLRPPDMPTPRRARSTSAPPKPAPRAADPKLVNRLVTVGIVFVACLMFSSLALGGYVVYDRMQATPIQPTAPVVVAVASVVFPTLPPAWTPTFTPTITLTPTITPTPTSTPVPTPLPPPESIAAEMDIIQAEVADIRGLSVQGNVQRYLIHKNRVRATLEELYLQYGGTREEINAQARVLSALGLIKPTFDLFTYTLNGISDGVGGFYTPWTRQLYVIGEEFDGVERWVYSHEYDHALTDMHFGINAMGVYPVCQGDKQRCAAIRALVEGDATLLMSLWFRQYATPRDVDDILSYNYDPSDRTLPEQFPPPFASRDAAFPYVEGTAFVEELYLRGNWAEVNRAYANLPQSTEHILHPEKYFAGETPLAVPAVALDGALGPEWQLLETNSLGEWMTFLILSYGADLPAQLNDFDGAQAAAGWGGDTYQVYYNAGAEATILVAHWVWDTPTDAREFREAMIFHQDERFRGAKVDRPDGDCWEANNQASCTFTRGAESLWIIAPNQSILNDVLARFPNFP